jgi:2-polyprenyl-6-methoxyphenol hydroxylase-like FAD-dependent oxidoreductase
MHYQLAFLDRHQLVKTLYDHLEDKSKVLLNKNVVAVEHSTGGVKVKCEDGSSYDGHVLVGADGVSSKTRHEMWRLAGSTEAGLVSEDKTCTCFLRELTTVKNGVIIFQLPTYSRCANAW